MKRRFGLLLLMILLICAGCKPKEETQSVGTEDGGGTGYGVTIQSVLKLSDFYSVAKSSTRENNRLLLGTPQYSLNGSDTYNIDDGSSVVLTYDSKGVLTDSMYMDATDGKNYTLFDKLVLMGVLRSSSGGSSTITAPGSGTTGNVSGTVNNNTGEPNTNPSSGNTGNASGSTENNQPLFSAVTYKRAAFDQGLSLYLDRNTVISTFGLPNYYLGRTYKKDSYIIDCYSLDDGNLLMLDYGYERKSLRCAALKDTTGAIAGYLGTWNVQTKPAGFTRNSVALNHVTKLKKGMKAEAIYQKLGEPQWYEGSAENYRDAYTLTDGSIVYLEYEGKHNVLSSAFRTSSDNKILTVEIQ